MKKIIPILFALGTTLTTTAQNIDNVDFYVSGETVIITYDFIGTSTNQRFDISLYYKYSLDSAWRPISLSYLSGDVGSSRSGGYRQRITWRVLEEHTGIEGDLAFKVKANCTRGCIDDDMVFVQGGTFQMGSNDGESNEKPVHAVTISSFYISKYEVTQRQWRKVMGTNPSYFKNRNNCPVENVSWNDVQDFLRKLNRQTKGAKYRLPTEAEWEYAARGGNKSRGYKYAGSNNIGDVAWYYNNSSSKTHPVGQKLPNELGLYDMTGNVWEWCSGWYNSYYSNSTKDPSSGSYRVKRGGGWININSYWRVAYRSYSDPSYDNSNLGFRLVVVPSR